MSWSGPDLGVGDEVVIRILPPGEFDAPFELKDSPAASIVDPVFGPLEHHINDWNGDIPLDCPPFQMAQVHLSASEAGPTDRQRSLFLEYKSHHTALWPHIANALVRCHTEITSIEELNSRINPHVDISIREDHPDLELSCSISGDPEYRTYSVRLRNWEIVEISTVD